MNTFDRDILLMKEKPFHFKVNVTTNWSLNDIPNGGYLMAILASAMSRYSENNLILIFTANFILRCVPGIADIFVEKIALSKQFTRLQAKLIQDGKERIRAVGTFTNAHIKPSKKRYESLEPEICRPEECVVIPLFPNYPFLSQFDLRLDPGCAGWIEGTLSDRSEQKGWVKFKDDRAFDMPAILLIADAFPPSVFATHGAIAWVPTLECSVNIRNLPKTKWLKCVFRTRFINNGILEEDGEIWDENGELIAISRQVGQMRKAGT